MLNYNYFKIVGTLFVARFQNQRHTLEKCYLTSKVLDTALVRKAAEVKCFQASPCLGRHSDTRLQLDRFRLALGGLLETTKTLPRLGQTKHRQALLP